MIIFHSKLSFVLKLFLCNAKRSGKEEETKMFRLFFALSLVFILGSYAVSQKKINQIGKFNLHVLCDTSLRVPIQFLEIEMMDF